MASPKLIKVPMSLYSVSFLSLALERSPNLNTNFAVINKPIALHWLSKINPKTNKRSIISLYFPAFFSESSDRSSSKFHLHYDFNLYR